jgi:hypothetical protein
MDSRGGAENAEFPDRSRMAGDASGRFCGPRTLCKLACKVPAGHKIRPAPAGRSDLVDRPVVS